MPTRRDEPTRHDDAPLIVTALLDEASFTILDGLRRRHFPTERNKVPAHVSLFHNLPGAERDAVHATVAETCARRSGFELLPMVHLFLGRGVAIRYRSADLAALRDTLARAWVSWLTPQDRQPFQAHVTLQNKVAPEVARALFETLDIRAMPICRVEGLALWRYRGGPWEPVATCRFRAPAA